MQYEVVRAIDNSASGVRVTGLVPTVVHAKTLATLADVSAHVAISEIGNGDYRVAYDATTYGDAAIQIDFTATIPLAGDRYKSFDIVAPVVGPTLAEMDAYFFDRVRS
jgi:hypothetical protein